MGVFHVRNSEGNTLTGGDGGYVEVPGRCGSRGWQALGDACVAADGGMP